MKTVITLGPNSHVGCPKCGRRTAFFEGEKGSFISDEKSFLANSVLRMECAVDGVFEVMAAGFRTER